jgi:hypothetical protein
MDRMLRTTVLFLSLAVSACGVTDNEESSAPIFFAQIDETKLCANPDEILVLGVEFPGRGIAPYTYEWSFDDPEIPNSTEEAPSISSSEKQNIGVSVTVTDSQGRTSTSSRTIRIKDDCTPVAAAIEQPSSDTNVEEGTSVDFVGAATGGDGPYTYDWSFFNVNTQERRTSSERTLSQTLGSGTWTVQLKVADSTGDIDNEFRQVTVSGTPRTPKKEYSEEVASLGPDRISELDSPGSDSVDLGSSGRFGFRVQVEPGQKINITTTATGPVSITYLPQFSPGYGFKDVGPGSTDLTNLDGERFNGVLVVLEGSGVATVSVTTE